MYLKDLICEHCGSKWKTWEGIALHASTCKAESSARLKLVKLLESKGIRS